MCSDNVFITPTLFLPHSPHKESKAASERTPDFVTQSSCTADASTVSPDNTHSMEERKAIKFHEDTFYKISCLHSVCNKK